jgi:periplasmic protein
MKKILILGALISSAAMAAGDVSVSNCLIQEVIPGKQMTGAFFDIENKGKEDVKLTGAAADKITSHVELHEMIHKDGKMEMSQIQEYNVTPGSVHHFKKGGYHVMLMQIEEKNFPKVGETYPLELKLSNGETLKCDAKTITVKEAIEHFKVEDGKAGGHDMKDGHDKKDEAKHEHKHG